MSGAKTFPFLMCLALCSCDVFRTASDDWTGSVPPGPARQLRLAGTTFRIGSSAEEDAPETGHGTVRFRHDVWMDTVEMRQSEFHALTGRNPSPFKGDDIPVTDVSWFDAVLCANARSRRDGLDSVYDYVSVQQDSAGNPREISGLADHLERNGWRLPTEAEWEVAARAGGESDYPWGSSSTASSQADLHAWNWRNSDGKPHPVGTLAANAWGLHDMAGNVEELVEDWKGPFPADTIDDYAGQDVPGNAPEIPVKGGSFLCSPLELRISNRAATYATFRSSRSTDVGFRLARGAMHAIYSGTGGERPAAPVQLLVSDILRRLGTDAAKLVFVDGSSGSGRLCWVDFSEASPAVRTIADPDPIFHPAISPDGRWVAWSTIQEGSNGISRIKVRRLSAGEFPTINLGDGAIPRWWTNAGDTFVVGASAMDNIDPAWGTSATRALRWSHGHADPAQVWTDQGAYHDGRSGQYLYSGFRRLRQWNVDSRTSRILFSAPQNGKGAGDTSQVCNVSAAPDSSGRVMFLDFGFSGNSTVVGHSYGIHEIAFVADPRGNVLQEIPVPGDELQWEDLEWTNSVKWAVSGATSPDGRRRDLLALDMVGGSAFRIASGDDLRQPALWIGEFVDYSADSAAPDSVGLYGNVDFMHHINDWWGRYDSVDVAILGSSHVTMGVLPEEMRSVTAHNLGFRGALLVEQGELLRRYVLPRATRLRAVVMSFDPGWLYEQQDLGSTYWGEFSPSKGHVYDRNHGYWTGGLPPGFQELAAKRVDAIRGSDPNNNMDRTGGWHRFLNDLGWERSSPPSSPIADQTANNPHVSANMDTFEALVQDITSRGLVFVLVKFPESPGYASSQTAGRWGPGWDEYHRLVHLVRELETKYSGFRFYDAYLDGMHDYTDGEAYNADHLNYRGAVKFSRRLDSVIAGCLRTTGLGGNETGLSFGHAHRTIDHRKVSSPRTARP